MFVVCYNKQHKAKVVNPREPTEGYEDRQDTSDDGDLGEVGLNGSAQHRVPLEEADRRSAARRCVAGNVAARVVARLTRQASPRILDSAPLGLMMTGGGSSDPDCPSNGWIKHLESAHRDAPNRFLWRPRTEHVPVCFRSQPLLDYLGSPHGRCQS